MNRPSAVVIGGGIIGLAVAERLSSTGVLVTLLEKESSWAAHQTGHNSGVIHAGPYYKPGSLKAAMCTAGNHSMVAFAREHGIPHEVCGKLIVATSPAEIPQLSVLFERAIANGAPARIIDADETREFEPHVSAVRGLRVENTGIIDYSAVADTLARLAEQNGADLRIGARVRSIDVRSDGVTVQYDGGVAGPGEVSGDVLVNCAGLQSDRIAKMAGQRPEVQIVPFRGEYYELVETRRSLVRGLIYPVPNPDLPFLGVHLTRMIDGSVHAGPNAVFAFAREGYRWRDIDVLSTARSITYPGFLRMAGRNIGTGAGEILRSLSKRRFAASLARLVPELRRSDIVRAGSGVRAQAIKPDGTLADDFIIQRAPRQVHVLNAPSPAATSSLEIAKYIAKQVDIAF